ncbi:SGNH/GDSL hydrolase family protein [Yoonia sp.]|uniref:SGNH/GDSL hydrolase family protein n=1 Tax=Yoonia sp. TaxID=2212373 RepID=UPI0023B5B7D4
MAKTVLTFGDSNTYGTPPAKAPGENRRFAPDTRWPCIMARALGDDWQVIEAGLPGRTTSLADPVMGAHMDGQLGLRIALEGHGPIDLLTIMLGTNDAQTHHARTAEQIVGGLAALLAIARSEPYQTRHGGFDILIIAPPPTTEQGTYRDTQMGAAEKSQSFAPLMGALAAHWGLPFFDAGAHVSVSPIDGVHIAAQDHQTLGVALAEKVRSL